MAKRPSVTFVAADPPPDKPISFFAGVGAASTGPTASESSATPPTTAGRWVWHLLAAGIVCLSVMLAYSNSFLSGWTLDNKYIIQLDFRNKTANWENFKLTWTQDYWYPKGISGLYRPITTLSYMLNWAEPLIQPDTSKFTPEEQRKYEKAQADKGIGVRTVEWFLSWLPRGNGSYANEYQQVLGFHWVNLLTHMLNAFLVYLLVFKLVKRWWVAAFAAVIFGIHPIGTESVTNIIGRADEFSVTATVGAILIYIRATEAKAIWKISLWLFALMLMTAFGLFSKEASVALGICVPLYDLTYRWRPFEKGWIERVLITVALCLVMLPPFALNLYVRNQVFLNSTPPEEPFLDNPLRGPIKDFAAVSGQSFIESRLTAFKVLGMQVTRLIWPASLSSDYSYNQIPIFDWNLLRLANWHTLFCFVLTIAAVLASFLTFKRNKPAFFFFWLFFFAMFPTSNIMIIIGSIMAERFMYLPLVGYAALFAMFVDWIFRRLGGSINLGPNDPDPVLEQSASAKPFIADRAAALLSRFRADTLSRFPFVAPALVALIVLSLGVRTYARNFAWESDITLWESAIKVAANAFRCHQSLAFAYYEKYSEDSAKGIFNEDLLNKMIYVAEGVLPIVDDLPHRMNSSRLYLHLGMYYGIKGETKMPKAENGQLRMTPESRQWFERSCAILERAISVDRAFNQVNRERDVRRGKSKNLDDPADVGLAPVYQYLSYSYTRLGEWELALQAMRYWRHLSPGDVEPYIKMADIYLQQGKYDPAAVLLVQALLLDASRPEVARALSQIYPILTANRPGGGWGEISADNRIVLNTSNPLIREHVVAAYRELIKIFVWAKQPSLSKQLMAVAVDNYKFDAALFQPIFENPGPAPVPPTPQFLKDKPKQWSLDFPPATQRSEP